jgi:hypothetical protein
MKSLTVAALLALLVFPAEAQMGGRHQQRGDDATKADPKKARADEKAYNEALKKIPDSKEKYDPWSGARPPESKAK